jgi:cytochrome P450
MNECATRFGDPFSLNTSVLGLRVAVFSSPHAHETIFTADTGTLSASGVYRVLAPLIGERSVLTTRGPEQRTQRRSLAPYFRNSRMDRYHGAAKTIVDTILSEWQAGSLMDVTALGNRVSIEFLGATLLAVQDSADRRLVEECLNYVVTRASALTLFFGALHRDLGGLNAAGRTYRRTRLMSQAIEKEIEKRRACASAADDFLDFLLSLQDEHGRELQMSEIRDQLLAFLLSAHATTPSALAWAFYWILRTPRVLHRLSEELLTRGAAPEPQEILRLPYLDAACREVLRICPPIPFVPRLVMRPFRIAGWDLPVGTMVSSAVYLTHHRQDVFSEPETFRPERFLEREFSAWEYLPFGGGAHRCPGASMALMIMKLLVGGALSRFRIELSDAAGVRPCFDRTAATLSPSRSVVVRVLGPAGPRV